MSSNTASDTANARVRVIVRVRPLRPKEVAQGVKEIVKAPENHENDQTLSIRDPASLLAGVRSELVESWSRDFTFDKCLFSNDPNSFRYARQEHLFDEVGLPVLDWCFSGFNCCVFAFGQTGSGKTYSMMGDLNRGAEHYGLVPRICFSMFDRIDAMASSGAGPSDLSVTFSHMEIYNDSVYDLLAPPTDHKPKTLRVREHPKLGVFVQDLTKVRVTTFEEVLGLVAIGDRNRTVAATNANSQSSRSHAIVTLTVVQRLRVEQTKSGLPTNAVQKLEGRVHLVDLAGSERVSLSGAKSTRLKEACAINKSLSVLADVILSLSSGKKRHVPYRNSAITMVLKDSLGGNAHSIMVATISPSNFDYDESISTLKYADRAKKVRMRVDANVSSGLQATDTAAVELVPLLQAEVQKLKEMLATQAETQAHEYIDRVAQLERQLEEREELIVSLEQQRQMKAQYASPSPEQRPRPPAPGSHISAYSQGRSSLSTYSGDKDDGEVEEGEQQLASSTHGSVGRDRVNSMSSRGSTPSKARGGNRPLRAVLAEDANDLTTPRLINLNQDPLFTECLVFYLPPGTKVTCGSREDCYVPLSAHDVLPEHCEMSLDPQTQEVVLIPYDNALVFVNGELIRSPVTLSTFDRLSLGRFHMFRFERKDMRTSSANQGGVDPTLSALVPGWEFAQQELLVKNNYFQGSASVSASPSAATSPAPPPAVSRPRDTIPPPAPGIATVFSLEQQGRPISLSDAENFFARKEGQDLGLLNTPSYGRGSSGTTTTTTTTGASSDSASSSAFTAPSFGSLFPPPPGLPSAESSSYLSSPSAPRPSEGRSSMRRSIMSPDRRLMLDPGNRQPQEQQPMYVPMLDSPHLNLKLPQSAMPWEQGEEQANRRSSETLDLRESLDRVGPASLASSPKARRRSGLESELADLEAGLDAEIRGGERERAKSVERRHSSPIVNLTASSPRNGTIPIPSPRSSLTQQRAPVPVPSPAPPASLPNAFQAAPSTSSSSRGEAKSRDTFEAEAMKLKRDLQNMQSALDNRLHRYKSGGAPR